MSRIDDAFRRAKGSGEEPPKGSPVKGFASEGVPRSALPADVRPLISHPLPAAGPAAAGPPLVGAMAAPRRKSAVHLRGRFQSEQEGALRVVTHCVGFACRAIFRHKLLVVVVFFLTAALVDIGTRLVPRGYEVEVKLLAQRNSMMTSLSNPGRTIPYDADAPTRAAAETVLRRDNLLALIRETDLLNEWERTRPAVLRFADLVKAKIRGHEPTLDERLDDLLTRLERHMIVSTAPGNDGTVSIYLYWPDAHSAFLLVERAQKAFIEARQVAETQQIAETITILERYTDTLHKDINEALDELSRTRTFAPANVRRAEDLVLRASEIVEQLPANDALVATVAEPTFDPSALVDPKLDRLRTSVGLKRAELSRMEEDHKRQLQQLESQLAVARQIYTSNHPTVQTLQQNIAALKQSSPRLVAVRNELDQLETTYDEQSAADAERLIRAELARRARQPATTATPAVRRRPAAVAKPAGTPEPPPHHDEVAEFATLRLRTELQQLQSILERTDAARIELAVSQAAFKFRYTIVTPAEEPDYPSYPDVRRVILTGLVASFLFALVVAIGVDIIGGRVLEPWQVRHQLGVPLLGTVR